MTSEKAWENRLRRHADRLGYVLRKDRARTWGLQHRGGYAIFDADTNFVVWGWDFDLELADLEEILAGEEARLRTASPAEGLGSDASTPDAATVRVRVAEQEPEPTRMMRVRMAEPQLEPPRTVRVRYQDESNVDGAPSDADTDAVARCRR